MHKFFYNIFLQIKANKWLSVLFFILFLVGCAFFSNRLKFEEDITRIIPKDEKNDAMAKVIAQLKFTDKVAVIIEKDKAGTLDDMTAQATDFLDSVQPLSNYYNDIQGQYDLDNFASTFDFVHQNLPLFLEKEDYKKLEQKLLKDSIASIVESNYKSLITPTGIVSKEFMLKDPLGLTFVALNRLKEKNLTDDFEVYNGFIVTKDHSKLFLFINPKFSGSETEHNTEFVNRLEEIQQHLNPEYSGKSTLSYFGSSFIAVANAKQIKQDIITTVLISMITLMIILIVFYRKIYIPIIIFIPSVFGFFFALALLYFIQGTISAISLSIGAVLLGITIDYSLHIMTHYKHNSDSKTLFKEITKPLIMSCTTTAIAFLCLLFVKSDVLKDLGIFAGITVIVSGVFSLLIIPHLYHPKEDAVENNSSIIEKLAFFSFHNNKILIGACVLLIIVSCFTFNNVNFDKDLSKLNYVPTDQKIAEQKLETSSNSISKSLYVVNYGNNVEDVLNQNIALTNKLEQAENKDEILSYNSIQSLVLPTSVQQEKIKDWENFWNLEKVNFVKNEFIKDGKKYGFKEEIYNQFFSIFDKAYQPLKLEDYRAFNPSLFEEFVSQKNGFYTISTLVKLKEESRENFIKQYHNKETIVIDRKQLNENFLGNLVTDFNNLVNYSFIAVLLILWYFFRRIELVIISAIPIALSGLVTAGLMGLFDIKFNIFSSIVCTLVFGHGVDFSIFMTSALQKEYTTGKDEMPTYRTSILLAVITTILAIGALIFAKHPALKSIASVSLVGVVAALVITFIFYPILFRFFISNRPKIGKSPMTLWLAIQSGIFFIYFGLFGTITSLILRFLMLILPITKEKKYGLFGWGMSTFMKSVLMLKPTVVKKIINPNQEDFKKQSIIIANHTSFLDTLAIGMCTPKIVFLVNDWVYKSPIFGRAVKMAGFYPVSNGVENNIEEIKTRIGNEFSLMIFPEGTRSRTNNINRFHKGAFYLAEKLQLDILPIYIHGNSEIIPKGEFLIFDGHIYSIIGKRIAWNDENCGLNYSERTKKISKEFKANFQEIRNQYEDENYWKQKLFLSFLYKESEIIQAVKKDFKLNKSVYHQLNNAFTKDERIVHFSNDFGQIDFLLLMQQFNRKIITFVKEEEKREVAGTNYIIKIRSLEYRPNFDVIDEYMTLLISTDIENIYQETINQFVKIVVLKNRNINESLFTSFAQQTETNEYTVYTK
ncbi:1-acyl-sn-glycerol-3-phosphate acyltransferase [Empedobacter falsenii]|uniref:2-acyl-glycerophospho-ethanolamine acyltransferase n=2 Tax=Pseudomonadati TaxID=3379134 RepID=A0A376G9R3_9FLAO|nr:1-acyl-sn-glycerol-3-phosphate acyltransferase [Empedobacter falsenii]STD55256.1 2-acyl-glycerophospho-ethanolamine acyltransferase [Empedobacter falsenii]